MSNKIQIKRGLKAKLPLLNAGEPAFTTDTKEFFIGDGSSNIEFAKQSDLKITNEQVSDLVYQVAGGTTGTAITLTMQTLVNGYAKTFIASANNGGVATTINGKTLYKPGTTTSPNIIAGKAYTVWYNSTGDCFFIKASAEGTALATHVLKDKTFSNDNDTGLVGTLDLSNLVTGNIKSGVTINGIAGSGTVVDTIGANLVEGYMLQGASGYANGKLIGGSIPNRPNLQAPSSYWASGGGTLRPRIPTGAYVAEASSGITEIDCYDSNYIASNIISGKSIFGLAGIATAANLGGRKTASGVTAPLSNAQTFYYLNGNTTSAATLSVTGLSFKPSLIVAKCYTYAMEDCTVYNELAIPGTHHFYSPQAIMFMYITSNQSCGSFPMKGNAGAMNIYNGGFTIPVYSNSEDYPGLTYSWIAYE